jgi:threonine 3-dehydrogenase
MQALVKREAAPGIWMEEVPVPRPGTNEVLIKLEKTAICGTDIHIYNWDEWSQRTIKPGLVIGHEFVGLIEELGEGVSGYNVGDRVSAEGHVVCGHCRNCRAGKPHLCPNTEGIGVDRNGAFAEYVVVPSSNLWPIPDEIAPDGIIAAGICRHVGARHVVITDVNDYRLDLAREMGASHTVNVSRDSIAGKVEELGIEGFDIGLEMSGHPVAFNDLLHHMYHGGKVALLGLLPAGTGVDWDQIIFKGLELHGIYGRRMYETWYKMTQMVLTGFPLQKAMTHHIPIADFQHGFDLMSRGQCGKVVCDWTGKI